METWQSTKLAKRLQELSSSGDEEAQAWSLVQRHLPGIETILSKAATSPKDFTLHDEEHAYRVAEWMVRIIPGSAFNALNAYECMLLVLAAYLHDIGMTRAAPCFATSHTSVVPKGPKPS
jgi:HD-GYP domain-containing protein (c-di-GMP phosphodiesterase class II)